MNKLCIIVIFTIIFSFSLLLYIEKEDILLYAMSNDIKFIPELCLGIGADLNTTDSHGLTPLSWAICFSNDKLTNYLLNNGANPNSVSIYGVSILFNASRSSNDNIVKLLIKNGAHVNFMSVNGETPLYTAIDNQNFVIANTLIANGADIHYVGPGGKTLLHMALQTNNLLIIEKLLIMKINPNARTNNKISPLEYAISINNQEMIDLLTKYGAK